MLLRAHNGDDVGMLCNAVRREHDNSSVADCVFVEVQERKKFEEALLHARQESDRSNAALNVRAGEAEKASALLQAQAVQLSHQKAELQAFNEELATLNEDLEQQREAADEANQAKSNFLAVMSHELRTPLNAIGGYVQLLEMEVHGPITGEQREALGRIDRSQRHLLRLINDVLNLSRIEAGRVDYVVERVPLVDVARSVMPMVEPQIAAKGLEFHSVLPANIFAAADAEKVQQILLNLFTNAIKFTAERGFIVLESGRVSESQVFLRVTDSGQGIPAAMLEKVFEPFIQVDATKSRAAEGTGLGLAISRDLARGMKGDLGVESVPGVGSKFQLNLPLAN
jgi:signal transduction histidine kinase